MITFTWNTSLAAVDELNPRQLRFAEEFAKGSTATDAAIAAGYSPKSAGSNADKLLKNTKVAAYILELKEAAIERAKIDVAWVLREAEDLYKECRQEGDRSNAKGTLDLIGKHTDIQAWKERIELDVNDPADIMAARISKRDAERKEVH